MRTKKKIMATLAVASVMALSPLVSPMARAASVTYYLDQNNESLPAANYLSVTISDGLMGNIDFEVSTLPAFSVLNPGSNFGMQEFWFNFNGVSLTASNLTNFGPSTWGAVIDTKNGSNSGPYGRFEVQVGPTSNPGGNRTTILTFSITGIDGDDASLYAVWNDLKPAATEFFAAHVGGFDYSGIGSAKFGGSTKKPDDPIPPIPLPSTLLLFGSGVMGLIFSRKRP